MNIPTVMTRDGPHYVLQNTYWLKNNLPDREFWIDDLEWKYFKWQVWFFKNLDRKKIWREKLHQQLFPVQPVGGDA